MNHGLPWKVSLHGGHSGDYCDHATGSLTEVLEAAVRAGYHTFGVSEHAPRHAEHLIFPDEIEMGYTVDTLIDLFDRYALDIAKQVDAFADRLVVLRGFETESVPRADYVQIMKDYRERYAFDFMVGSVHHIHEIPIDGPREVFDIVVEMSGGLEPLVVQYYRYVAEMVEALKPDVVSHLDLVRRNAPSNESVEKPKMKAAAREALEAVRDAKAILDLNTAGYRKGLTHPYPAPWLLKEAHAMGIPFCFGDDSHGPDQVGAGIDDARLYLLENGVDTVTVLTRENDEIVRKIIPLTGE